MSIQDFFGRAKRRVERLFGSVNRQVAWAAGEIVTHWKRDSAHWIEGERRAQDRHEIGLGIFDASIFGSRECQEYLLVLKWLTAEGLCAQYRCQRCGTPQKLKVNWLELAAVAVDAAPELMPEHLRAGWGLGEPSAWWRDGDGAWRPDGVRCNCGNESAPPGERVHPYYGRVRYGEGRWLPGVYPAEVRAMIFSAMNERKMPASFFAAVALYAWLKVACAARARLDELLGKAPTEEPEPEPEPSEPEPIAAEPEPPTGPRLHIRLLGEPLTSRFGSSDQCLLAITDAQRFQVSWTRAGCYELLRHHRGRAVGELREQLREALRSVDQDGPIYGTIEGSWRAEREMRQALKALSDTANAYPDAVIHIDVEDDRGRA